MSKHVLLKRMWVYLKPYQVAINLAIFWKIISAVMNALEPFVLGLIITELTENLLDMVHGKEGAAINVSYVAIFLLIYAVRALFYELGSYYSNYFMTKGVQQGMKDLRQELSRKLHYLPISYLDQQQQGDILSRFTTDVDTVSNALQQSILQLINAVLTLTLALVMSIWIDPTLSLLVLLLVPVTYLSSKFIMERSQPYFKQQADALGRLTGFIQEQLTGFHILQLYGRQEEISLCGQVSFEQVSFGYSPEAPLITDFNLQVQPGEMVAIVGPTGAGKTTLINLLLRFYDVTSGVIRVDGVDIRQLPRSIYRRQFGMVLQDAWLYEGSIADNLRFGRLDASEEEMVAAAQAANVDHFIRTLPGGYQMLLNQESSNISQGQKQLLTIARALLTNPAILILDEATSSVDTRLELLIQKAMKKLMRGRTSFVIAHRLSTIQEADCILVLKDGQIMEQGKHDDLLSAGGFYHDLYQSQFSKKQ